MLVVRFRETFRERMPEWVNSAGMLGWGLLVLASSNLFLTQPFFYPLLYIMTQMHWGLTVAGVGITRLIFLVVNGAWRPSAHIRAVGCIFGAMFWTCLLLSALNLSWMTPTSAIYSLLIFLDMLSLWFASGDAKLADLSAKDKVKKK